MSSQVNAGSKLHRYLENRSIQASCHGNEACGPPGAETLTLHGPAKGRGDGQAPVSAGWGPGLRILAKGPLTPETALQVLSLIYCLCYNYARDLLVSPFLSFP